MIAIASTADRSPPTSIPFANRDAIKG